MEQLQNNNNHSTFQLFEFLTDLNFKENPLQYVVAKGITIEHCVLFFHYTLKRIIISERISMSNF